MLPYKRSERVAHQLKKEVSDIIMNRLKDPRMGFTTVTGTEVSDDLKHAKVFISTLNDDERDETLEALISASKFIRSELSKRLRMKSVPALHFRADSSVIYGQKIEKLFNKIHEEDGPTDASDDGTDPQ